MVNNPWHVDSILEFSVFKCPECIFDSKDDSLFQDHALENHPLSFALFGKIVKDEELTKDKVEDYSDTEEHPGAHYENDLTVSKFFDSS